MKMIDNEEQSVNLWLNVLLGQQATVHKPEAYDCVFPCAQDAGYRSSEFKSDHSQCSCAWEIALQSSVACGIATVL